MVSIQADLLRKDAGIDIDWDVNLQDHENDAIDATRARKPLYKEKLENIFRYIKLFKLLSPFHADLLAQIDDEGKSDDDQVEIADNILEEFW